MANRLIDGNFSHVFLAFLSLLDVTDIFLPQCESGDAGLAQAAQFAQLNIQLQPEGNSNANVDSK